MNNTFPSETQKYPVENLRPANFQALGLPERVAEYANLEQGLILINGGNFTGRSETLNAFIDHINYTNPGRILTVETPIHFFHRSKRCNIQQIEVIDDESFTLQDALNQVEEKTLPQYIFIDTYPNPTTETIKIAITLAESGHLVFMTTMEASASWVLYQMVQGFPDDEQESIRIRFANSLQAVITQSFIRETGILQHSDPVMYAEILTTNESVQAHIREGMFSDLATDLERGLEAGMQTALEGLDKLVVEGLISAREAAQRASIVKLLDRDYHARCFHEHPYQRDIENLEEAKV